MNIEGSNKIFVKADKSRNFYKMNPNNKQMLQREVS